MNSEWQSGSAVTHGSLHQLTATSFLSLVIRPEAWSLQNRSDLPLGVPEALRSAPAQPSKGWWLPCPSGHFLRSSGITFRPSCPSCSLTPWESRGLLRNLVDSAQRDCRAGPQLWGPFCGGGCEDQGQGNAERALGAAGARDPSSPAWGGRAGRGLTASTCRPMANL